MTLNDTVDILALCAVYDRRTFGDPDAVAWHAILGDYPFADARDAVLDYYHHNREWIMPADIVSRVMGMRRERLDRTPVPEVPAELRDDPIAYRDWVQAHERAIANGEPLPGREIAR